MKKGWEEKKLGDICEIERGGSPRPIESYLTDSEDGINWTTADHAYTCEIAKDTFEFDKGTVLVRVPKK